jgi:hypothetical protein
VAAVEAVVRLVHTQVLAVVTGELLLALVLAIQTGAEAAALEGMLVTAVTAQ